MSLQSFTIWMVRAQWTLASLTVLLVGGFFVFGYCPGTARLNGLDAQISKARADLSSSRNQTSILPAVAQEVERLRSKLKQVKSIPRQQELPQFIKDIAQLGDQASLKKFDLKPGVPARSEQFSELPVQLTFEGDFVNVYSFLRHAEELQRLTRVRGMSIRSRDKLGQVKVQLTMNIYFSAD